MGIFSFLNIDLLLFKTHFAGFFYSCIVLFALSIGSYLNVVIYRLPRRLHDEWRKQCYDYLNLPLPTSEQSASLLTQSRSCCTHCQHRLAWYDLIPIISWCILAAKCRYCKQRIAWQYPAVELSSVIIAWAVATHADTWLYLFAMLFFSFVLLALSVIDWQHQLLPDRLVLPLLMVGLAVNSIQLVVSLEQAVWGAIIGFLSLWGIAKGFQLYTGKQGMGDGDFKLLAALGAWTGVQSLLFIIMLAAVLGIIVGIVQYRRLQQHQAFAFGPYLAIAAWLYMLYAPYFPLYLFGM